MRIRLIGAFSLEDADGRKVALAGRKDRALLAFLAAHLGRPIARERLVELIWPRAADGAGRASLRQSLSVTRKSLPQPEALLVERDTLSLQQQFVETDLGWIENREAPERLLTAAPMANGESFLDDLGGISSEFDTWRATQQSRLVLTLQESITQVAAEAEVSNDVRTAVAALAQLIALDPLNEDAQRRYMKGLIALGQPNSAIRQYHTLDKLLREELGVSPDHHTRSVFQEAKHKAAPLTATRHLMARPDTRTWKSAETDQPKVIVNQFRDLSPAGENEHFAQALFDSILMELSQISGLKVHATPVTSGSGSQVDELKQRHENEREPFALEGSVHQGGTRIRVSAKLIGTITGQVFWAQTYEREFDDIFAVQDDITHRIAVEMRVKLSEGEKIRTLAHYTQDLQVWSRLMRADVLTNNLVEEDSVEARRLLREAVQIDPGCAAAWGELADTYLADYMMGRQTLPMSEYLDEAMRAAEKALDAEPSFTHALNTVSFVQMARRDYATAIETTRKAMAAAPRNPEISANCAYVLAFSGVVDEAEVIISRAIEVSPIPPMWYLTLHGLCLYMMDQFEPSIRLLKEAARMVPESTLPKLYLIGALMENGDSEAAAEVASEIRHLQPDFKLSCWPGADFANSTISERLIVSLMRAGVAERQR
jgi:DNA-binding SARP family transcriptional activator/Tfp pilus assembly protein PilF